MEVVDIVVIGKVGKATIDALARFPHAIVHVIEDLIDASAPVLDPAHRTELQLRIEHHRELIDNADLVVFESYEDKYVRYADILAGYSIMETWTSNINKVFAPQDQLITSINDLVSRLKMDDVEESLKDISVLSVEETGLDSVQEYKDYTKCLTHSAPTFDFTRGESRMLWITLGGVLQKFDKQFYTKMDVNNPLSNFLSLISKSHD
jgi:hypothetical protein